MIADLVSEQTSFGMAQRALVMFGNQQTDSVGTLPASQPANGQNVPPGLTPEYFHTSVYGAAVDNHGNADCEATQRGYVKQLNHFDPQHRNFATDPHNPGDQGTTWNGRTHVPTGETFTRAPITGPQLANNPNNP